MMMQIDKRIILLAQSVCNKHSEKLWSQVADNDFGKIIELFKKEGIRDDDIGEILYVLACHAADEGWIGSARLIILFLITALQDQEEAPLIISFLGDLYAKEGDYVRARECYAKLPVTLDTIRKLFNTFIPFKDIDGILETRDAILNKSTDSNHENIIHGLVNSFLVKIADDPQIKDLAASQYAKNIEYLKQIDPSVVKKLYSFKESITSGNHLNCLKINDKIYVLNENKWRKVQPKVFHKKLQRKHLSNGVDIIIRCALFEQLIAFRDALITDHPEFIKYKCYLITDLNMFESFMTVENLLPLAACDFFIKIISENDFENDFYEKINEGSIDSIIFLSYTDEDLKFKNKILIPFLKKVENNLTRNVEINQKKIVEIFPDNYSNKVFNKIKKVEKLNILFLTSRFTTYLQYATRDIADGFKELGHEILILKEQERESIGIPVLTLLKTLVDFQPDLVFVINHLRYEIKIPKTIPFVTWVQDPVQSIFELSDPSAICDNDYIYVISKIGPNSIDRFAENPAFKNCQIRLLPIVFNKNKYFPINTNFKYDISYVSHFNIPKEYYEVYSDLPDSKLSSNQLLFKHFKNYSNRFSIFELSDVIYTSYKDRTFWMGFVKDFISIFPNLEKSINYDSHSYFCTQLMQIIIKSRILKKIIDHHFDLHLYGKGWELHPWFRKCAKGPIQNGIELNKVYNETKINLNLNPAMLLHPKFTEVAGGGNFCLTLDFGKNICAPIMDYFNDSTLIPMFNEDNLLSKLRYYLDNSEERERVANILRNDVLNKFTVKVAANNILQDICHRHLLLNNHMVVSEEC